MTKLLKSKSKVDRDLMRLATVNKEAGDMSAPTRSIYGRNSIFDPCVPGDIFGLQVETNGLMNWIGWRPNKFYRRRVDFITWWGPEGTDDGTQTTGATAPCDDPPGWTYGSCGYELLHTSWYSRSGDALDPHTIVQDRCETSPRYRLNGTQIADDVEWQANGMMNVLQQSVRRDLVHGSHDNANEMDGLESIIRTGYQDAQNNYCPDIDSNIIAWGNDNLDGDSNGLGNFFDYMDELITEIEWKSSAMGTIAPDDMAIVTSRFMATGLLDAYACYTTCGVTDTNDITDQALRAQQRSERRALNGGPLYDGRNAVGFVELKSGRRLPILVEDTFDIHKSAAGYASDVYLLTRRIGSLDVLYGEYLDLRIWESKIKRHDPDFRGRSDMAGRFALKGKETNFCTQLIMGTSPELYLSAPWAQARFTDVSVARKRKPLTGDMFQPLYGKHDGWLYPAQSYE